MDWAFLMTLFLIGLAGSFVSAMTGLGGAIIIVPALLYLPPLVSVGCLDMKQVAGITITMVFTASLIGTLTHHQHKSVSKSLVLIMGITGFLTCFAGAYLSKFTKADSLLAVFAAMSVIAAIMMWIPRREQGEDVLADEVQFNRAGAFLIALVVGFVGGMVGAPGAYIFIPLMIYILQIPTRIALGSTMGIVFISSVAGLLGKIFTGQVPYLPTAAVVLGAIPGARWGGQFSHRVPVVLLRRFLAFIIGFAAIRMIYDVLT
ncbi:MAG: sulfite exporter TauE/SafE family protein [Thermodesulfobacteriota bacterium]